MKPEKLDIYFSINDKCEFPPTINKKIKEAIQSFKGKRVHFVLSTAKNTRSNQQNRYYWSGFLQSQIDCFRERWGEIWSKEQCHDWNKNNIWGTEFIDENSGVIYKKPGSSATQKTTEFELCLEKGRQFFFTNFDWIIPLPNEQLTID